MVTAVDSNVLIDVIHADPAFGPASREALRGASADGAVIISDVVWAETGGVFPSGPTIAEIAEQLGIDYVPLGREAASEAAAAWSLYRARGGRRERVIADFLVGAHAIVHADRLLTRDGGFYRSYFRKLKLLDPTTSG